MKKYSQVLHLAAIYLVFLVWVEWEILINTGRLWISWQPFLFPLLPVDLVWMLGGALEWVRELNQEISFQEVHVPEWMYIIERD
jgi:hypothetical protein